MPREEQFNHETEVVFTNYMKYEYEKKRIGLLVSAQLVTKLTYLMDKNENSLILENAITVLLNSVPYKGEGFSLHLLLSS